MNHPRPYILAIDVGTSALKGVIYEQAGSVLGMAVHSYGFKSPQLEWAEAQPHAWWKALLSVTRQLKNIVPYYSEISVVAITGQMHTAVLLDKKSSKPINPTILWLDRRAAAETAELQQYFKLPPYQLNSTYTLPKLLWFSRHFPKKAERVCTLLFPKDYLRYQLTGNLLTDYTEAGGAALLDWDKMVWAEERLVYAGFTPDILPPLHHPTDDAGTLLPEIANKLGLSTNVRVLVGAGDVLALVTGAPPAVRRVACSLGSSSMVFYPLIKGQDFRDPQDRIYTYPLLAYPLLGGVSSTSGAAMHWAYNAFYQGSVSFKVAIEEALKQSPGAGNLVFLPFLSGERSPFWSDILRGSFYGLSLTHTRAHMLRAVMEGVAFSMRYLFDIFYEIGVPLTEIALAGGGTTIPGLPEIIADVCQLPVTIFAGQETVTHGLYAYACQAFENIPFEQALAKTFSQPVVINPRPQQAEIYQHLYSQYCKLANFTAGNLH